MPRAVLFDLFNTLVPGGTDEERATTTAAMGADLEVDPEAFTAAWYASWPERASGILGDLPATVRTIAARVGGSPPDTAVRLACARRIALTRRLLWPSGSTLAALEDLRAGGWRLGLASNATAEVPDLWKRTPLAPFFDALGFSCELGVAKPDPGIYLAVCATLRVTPAECLYVGDGADNELAGAANLGMAVVRTEEHRSVGVPWPREPINSLTELLGRR
jgi:putative hydrolase of the HAD superfamily